MKRFKASKINENNKKINEEANSTCKKESEVGNNLLNDHDLSLQNVEELGQLLAEKHGYDKQKCIICNMTELIGKLDSHKNDNIDEKAIFVICHDENNNTNVTFCITKLSDTIFCLYKDFSNVNISEHVKDILKQSFGQNIQFKINTNFENERDEKNIDILCLKTLETMMLNLKPNKKESFIKDFANPRQTFFAWVKEKASNLKDGLFSLVKDGYYATIASDLEQLSKDTEFKQAIKKFIDDIPFTEEANLFKNYQVILKQFAEMPEDEIDFNLDHVKQLQANLEQAKELAFSKIRQLATDLLQMLTNTNVNGIQQLNIQTRFPDQMQKFTQIFKTLTKFKTDDKFDEELQKIASKLDLDYEKLKIFFVNDDITKEDSIFTVPRIENIEDVINALPKLEFESSDSEIHKTFDELLSEVVVQHSENLNIRSLGEGYFKIKDFYVSWSSKSARKINKWAKSKKGSFDDSEIYEAIAALDRANELVTGGHKLRDTQILAILTFLLQKGKGQLSQIQTGEGKTTIVSILAAIKALKGEKVDVITSNPVLASDGIKDRKLFYDILNLSVAANNLDENYKSGPRECYGADIVYGSVSNFQFDYLKDSFLGLATRAGRPFESVILDEVDSMIIDNASHIAKLSEPMPGMESLKYVYIKIWQELYKAEEKITLEFGKQLEEKAQELHELSIPDDDAQSIYDDFQDELEASVTQKIKDSIKLANPTKIDIIPSHIQQYADNSLDRWIDSALAAKFVYHEDEQYVIRIKNKEEVIQPVDYANTGMTLKNTIWQHGLHQFLQLKHNLHLTSENLTSCFISNLGYINKYGDQIYGLTGTLGSEAEQRLLSSIYNVGYAKIPTYKEKKFVEFESQIVNDKTFASTIADNILSILDDDRAVLTICETIKDAKSVLKELNTLDPDITIKTFFDEENAHITEEEVDSGDVVIATNIAGRGTDFKTSDYLESNKGLHVCVAFLPCNKRVEDQAFGRTARQGNQGSAQLIMKRSEVEKLDIDSYFVEDIKKERDQKETERIQLIQDIKIPELKFQDKLFERFSSLCRSLERSCNYEREHKFVLDDLKEYWAFWLNNQKYDGSEIANKDVDKEFSRFEAEAHEVINGKIQFNPYYSIQQAEYYLSSNNKLDDAEKSLNHAINISKNPEILHSAYLKQFEIAIERGWVFTDKCRRALGDCFLIPFVDSDREYKQKAKGYLEKAKKAFQRELDYIEKLFKDEEFLRILRNETRDEDIENSSNEPKTNLFVKHIVSKQQALSLEISHAESIVQQIDKKDIGLSVGCRIPDYIVNLKPKTDNEKEIKKIIANSELAELAASGANITYALIEVHDVRPGIATAAKIQIGGGIALTVTGICFPPALPVTSSIGGTMINEGLCDVAIELISMNNDGKFEKEAYIKGKVISYGISLLTMGINAALQCPKILEKAKNACRWIADTLRKCPYFTWAFEYVASHFDKLAKWFEKMETLAKFKNMTKLEKLNYMNELKNCDDANQLRQLGENIKEFESLVLELQQMGNLTEMTHLQNVYATLTQMTINMVKTVVIRTVEHAIMTKIITPKLTAAMSGLKPKIKEHVEKSVKENINRGKLKYNSFEEIQNIIKEIRESIDYETVKEIFKNTILGIAKNCNNWKVQLGALVFDQLSSWSEVYNHVKYLCDKINKKLKSDGKLINQNVDEIIDKLIEQLSEEIYAQVVSTTIKTCKDIYVIGKSARDNYKRAAKDREKCLQMNENFKNGGPAGQEHIAALSDDVKRPIHIHKQNGQVVILGKEHPGDPINIRYFPPDENNPSGHYVPLGEDENWSFGNNRNNCVFDAVGSQIGTDGETLRQNTLKKIESDPENYMAPHVREVFGTDILLEGGRRNQPIHSDYYPHGIIKIKVAYNHVVTLSKLRNLLNNHKKESDDFESMGDSKKLRYMNHSKSIPGFGPVEGKEEMMMGTMQVPLDNNTKLELITLSGNKAFFVRQSVTDNGDLNFTAEPIPMDLKIGDFTYIDTGKPTGNVYDVYNRLETNIPYTTSCCAAKFMHYVGEYLKAHPERSIVGDIKMAESWYKPGNAPFSADQVIINRSCSGCETFLPWATGKDSENK